ncbi:MAG: hypothetical protein V4538_15590 [Bacteroidota bacterium]
MVQSGNVSINPEGYKDKTKEQFIEDFKGKVAHDINILWDQVCQCNANKAKLENESNSTTSGEVKEPKNKRIIKSSGIE